MSIVGGQKQQLMAINNNSTITIAVGAADQGNMECNNANRVMMITLNQL
jgi:hypothetical protein